MHYPIFLIKKMMSSQDVNCRVLPVHTPAPIFVDKVGAQEGADVLLIVRNDNGEGETTIFAHKCILQWSSAFFSTMMKSQLGKDQTLSTVSNNEFGLPEINLTQFTEEVILAVLRFVYSGMSSWKGTGIDQNFIRRHLFYILEACHSLGLDNRAFVSLRSYAKDILDEFMDEFDSNFDIFCPLQLDRCSLETKIQAVIEYQRHKKLLEDDGNLNVPRLISFIGELHHFFCENVERERESIFDEQICKSLEEHLSYVVKIFVDKNTGNLRDLVEKFTDRDLHNILTLIILEGIYTIRGKKDENKEGLIHPMDKCRALLLILSNWKKLEKKLRLALKKFVSTDDFFELVCQWCDQHGCRETILQLVFSQIKMQTKTKRGRKKLINTICQPTMNGFEVLVKEAEDTADHLKKITKRIWSNKRTKSILEKNALSSKCEDIEEFNSQEERGPPKKKTKTMEPNRVVTGPYQMKLK